VKDFGGIASPTSHDGDYANALRLVWMVSISLLTWRLAPTTG
jgi:hypothetical protein